MDKRSITACFTGHRLIREQDRGRLRIELKKTLEDYILKGYTYFGNGGAWGFDLLAAEVILELREKHPQIKLIMVLPYPEQTDRWKSREDIKTYNSVLKKADKITIMCDKYIANCFALRNKRLIAYSSLVISYCYDKRSGTGQTIRMAEKEGLKIINLASKAN